MKNVLLKELVVLYIDCQATNPNPAVGQLLEIGWAQSDRITGGREKAQGLEVRFVKPPTDYHIPARVSKVTGITDDDVQNGEPPGEVWTLLQSAARSVARRNHSRKCLTVIHFARFETAYLEMLHSTHGRRSSFPFAVLCTHEIARRLFPELPRRGIKALAGYFGYASDEKRRCADHLRATAHIWQSMVTVLAREYQVTTLQDLQKWLAQVPPRTFKHRSYPMKEKYRRHLPDAPGVYRMCRSNDDILYVGKARSLKKRVNSYFRKRGHHAGHILDMLTQARKIHVVETGSALEAALLESDLIKEHNPPYNVALRVREREVLYSDSAYSEFASTPSRHHHVGPLTSKDPLHRLSVLKPILGIVGSDINTQLLQEAITLSESQTAGLDVVQEGVEMFIARNQTVLSEEPAEYALVRLGLHLWLYRDDPVLVDEEDIPDNDEEGWSPEHVARALENVVMRSMHTIRRARLYVLLAESSIAWQELRGDTSRYFYIMLDEGAITQRGVTPRRKRPPVPPGYRKTVMERKLAFTVAEIDRLRVLITELRRIVDAGLWVRVRLRPRVTLDNEKLERIFTWV
jgi:DNA polymerase III epsilon subunit-like protein